MEKNIKENLRKKEFFLLVLIIAVGAFLRLTWLSSYPVGFHSQEALLGYRAASLLATGKDELGRSWPLLFSSFDGYQPPLSTYFVIPSVRMFGLNEFAVRLPLALFGVSGILFLFIIVRLLFPQGKKTALWAAFFGAVNPWGVWQSRAYSLSHFSLFLFLGGFAFLLLGARKQWFYLGAIVFLTGSLYTAKLAWLFIPPFLLLFWFFKKKKEILGVLLLTVLLSLPLVLSYIKAPQAVFDLKEHELTLLNDITIQNSINMMRGESIEAGSPFWGRLFYNKIFYGVRFLESFFKHFNPRFYFAAGDSNPLHGLSNFGPIFLSFLPFTLLGLWIMLKKHKIELYFFLFWFILGVIPSALVFPSPDLEKAVFIFPVLAILSVYSLVYLKRSYLLIFCLIFIVNFTIVFYDALAKEPLRSQAKWQYGYKKLTFLVKENLNSYDKIFLTDNYGADPGPLLLFYLDYPAEKLIRENQKLFMYKYWIGQVGKITIGQKDLWGVDKSVLFIVTPEEEKTLDIVRGYKRKEVIQNLNNETIFSLYSFEGQK